MDIKHPFTRCESSLCWNSKFPKYYDQSYSSLRGNLLNCFKQNTLKLKGEKGKSKGISKFTDPVLSALKGNRKFEILFVKIFSLIQKQLKCFQKKIKFCLFKKTASYVPLQTINFVEISNREFK